MRWRAFLRLHTPNFLYDRGLMVPKARDCGDHDWHNEGDGMDGCYHCKVIRPHQGPPWNNALGQPPEA